MGYQKTMTEKSIQTQRTVQDDVLLIRATREATFGALTGGVTTAPIRVGQVRIEADPDLAAAIGHELLEYAHEGDGAGPPEGKPMHDQYADAEPDP